MDKELCEMYRYSTTKGGDYKYSDNVRQIAGWCLSASEDLESAVLNSSRREVRLMERISILEQQVGELQTAPAEVLVEKPKRLKRRTGKS